MKFHEFFEKKFSQILIKEQSFSIEKNSGTPLFLRIFKFYKFTFLHILKRQIIHRKIEWHLKSGVPLFLEIVYILFAFHFRNSGINYSDCN
jgi:hypothetical protein